MSDTPITDAAEFDFNEDCTPEYNMVVASCDMRKLERKLNEAKADADALAEAVEIMRVGICSAAMPNATEREIASDAVKQASEVLKAYRNKYKEGEQ